MITYALVHACSAGAQGYRLSLRRRRRPDRGDRHHRRLVHRLLRTHPRRDARRARAARSAVEAGWKRAQRTILASDTVNLLAAVVLYILAVGDVRGFALHARPHHAHRPHRRSSVHPPDAAAARPHAVLRRGPHALRSRPEHLGPGRDRAQDAVPCGSPASASAARRPRRARRSPNAGPPRNAKPGAAAAMEEGRLMASFADVRQRPLHGQALVSTSSAGAGSGTRSPSC